MSDFWRGFTIGLATWPVLLMLALLVAKLMPKDGGQ